MQKELQKIITKAISVLKEKFNNHDLVRVDVETEKNIIQILKKLRVPARIFSEEYGRLDLVDNPKITIFLDPLDGSGNFIKGIPLFCVSAAYLNQKVLERINLEEIKYAVVTSSVGFSWEAKRGFGTIFNNKKIDPTIDFKKIKLESAFYRFYGPQSSLLNPKNFRLLGSSAFELGLVANGVFDTFIDLDGLKLIDLIPLYLILKEAGCIITDKKGQPLKELRLDFTTKIPLVITKNQKLHKEIIKKLKGEK